MSSVVAVGASSWCAITHMTYNSLIRYARSSQEPGGVSSLKISDFECVNVFVVFLVCFLKRDSFGLFSNFSNSVESRKLVLYFAQDS